MRMHRENTTGDQKQIFACTSCDTPNHEDRPAWEVRSRYDRMSEQVETNEKAIVLVSFVFVHERIDDDRSRDQYQNSIHGAWPF